MGWRDQKRQMRQQVHAAMRIACWRISVEGVKSLAYARLKVAAVNVTNDYTGELLSEGYAERANMSPRLIFKLSEGVPSEGDVYVFEANEAYGVETIRDTDDITVTTDCYRLSEVDARQLVALHSLTFPVKGA